MLKTRIITAVIAIFFLVLIFKFATPTFMQAFFTILVGLATWETAHMILPGVRRHFAKDTSHSHLWLELLTTLLAPLIFVGVTYAGSGGLSVLVIGILGLLALGIFVADCPDLSFGYSSGLVLCLVYGIFPWLAISHLFSMQTDSRYLYLMCIIVWAGDTGAYFTGRSIGKRKLAPKLSPNKTWEGACGGLVASLVGASLVKLYYGSDFPSWAVILVCAVFGGAFGQLGDLTESAYKRFAGVKDSGRLFPGHGGFLDRVDGLLFAAPVVWLILYQFGISE